MFKIIPAIDIRGGLCVRLFKGDFSKEKIYSSNPVLQAKLFEEQGADEIHVVDLDGALEGHVVNLQTVSEITKNTNVVIEFGGGLRSIADIKKLDEIGVKRFVLGSSIFYDPSFTKNAIEEFGPERIIAGVDIKDGRLALKAWVKTEPLVLKDFLLNLEKMGFKEIIFTNTNYDGTMSGPDILLLNEILSLSNLTVTVSGGISSFEDIEKVKNLKNKSIRGIILGRALYEEKILLSEAIKRYGE